jgi:tetratricopeptide (TPR) repeat protein
VLVAIGDAARGREVAERVLESGRTVNSEQNAYEFLALLEALIAADDWDALADFLPKARAMQPALALIEPTADRAEGLVVAAAGDAAAAETLLRRSVSRFDELGAVFEAARAREDLGRVLDEREELERALDIYRRLGARPHEERAAAALLVV